jgi:hypothetical protein
LKMGVPREAVERQKALDMNLTNQRPLSQPVNIPRGSIPPPPPPPSLITLDPSKTTHTTHNTHNTPLKINASELQSVKLKSSSQRVVKERLPDKVSDKAAEMGYFEPPSLEDIQSMLGKLKSTKHKQ